MAKIVFSRGPYRYPLSHTGTKNSRNVFKFQYGSQYRNKPGRTCTPTAVPIRVANRTCTPTAVPIRVANHTCNPTAVPVRLVQKSQRLVSEEHVPIRLRVYRYDLYQKCRNCRFLIPNCSKTSPTVTNG
ncbi:hypothetical protein V6N13_071433 [Hibiscus sabdariffa]